MFAQGAIHPKSLLDILLKTLGTTQAIILRTIASKGKEIQLIQSRKEIETPPVYDFIEVIKWPRE